MSALPSQVPCSGHEAATSVRPAERLQTASAAARTAAPEHSPASAAGRTCHAGSRGYLSARPSRPRVALATLADMKAADVPQCFARAAAEAKRTNRQLGCDDNPDQTAARLLRKLDADASTGDLPVNHDRLEVDVASRGELPSRTTWPVQEREAVQVDALARRDLRAAVERQVAFLQAGLLRTAPRASSRVRGRQR